MRQLVVVPHGGLCNRLRVLLSALHVGRQLPNVRVEVVWESHAECGADFSELFQPISAERFGVRQGAFWLTPVTRRNAHLPALLRSCRFDKQIALYHPKRNEDIEALMQRYRRLYISTPYALCTYPPALAQLLRPTAALQSEINACLQRFNIGGSTPSLGVHIRRTDNVKAKAVSTLPAFEEGIRRFLQYYPQGIVYVASDEPEVATSLAHTLGDRDNIRFRPAESINRARSEDIKRAVVDLCVLSACTYVLGSYWSSFSDMAAELGNRPLMVAGKDDVAALIKKNTMKQPSSEVRTLVFATNNEHKLSEVRDIFGSRYRILSLSDIGCHADIPETAETLEGNALQKAQYVQEHYGLDCFADDTGLEVDALGGRPGVHTARYAFPDRHDPEANTTKLLAELEKKPNRKARFRTVIALLYKGEQLLFDGRVEGTITTSRRGTQGFGYDPVFQPDGYDETFAELGVEVKNRISHRARAVAKLVLFLSSQTS